MLTYVLATLLDIRTSFCALIRRRTILMVQTSVWAGCNVGYGFPLSSDTNISKFQFDHDTSKSLFIYLVDCTTVCWQKLPYSVL